MDSQGLKPRLATIWLGGCSGCHMSFLDMDERLIDLALRVDLCSSPLVDVKEFPNVDVTLVEGAVANEAHVHELEIVRARSRIVVAFGDCAVTGNVTAMRNAFGVEDVLTRAYRSTSAVVVGVPDGADGMVPRLLPRVRPLHELVKVDYFLQGCPPSADEIYTFLNELLEGRTPTIRRFG
ncbi:MAG: oxidoreductase [Deltaproteobacteria bacterium]|nr:oxidoreductase [Deltaproteobacteria bacterium]